MYSTQVYIYQQILRVIMMDTGAGETFTYRYNPVYAKRLTINKGVDNVILFEFINQEEKPVNITGSTFVFRTINQPGTKVLVDEPLVILNGPTGRAKVTLTAEQLLEVQAQPANYSIVRTSGVLNEAVFTNANSGARAPVDIVDSVLPQFIPSSELTIPTLEASNQLQYDGTAAGSYPGGWYWSGNPNGGWYWNSQFNTEYFSSFIEPRGPVTTIQMDLIGYTGTIKAQWAENYESLWYNCTESTTYYNETRTIYLNVVGWYPLLRLAFNNSVFATPENFPGYPAIAVAYCEGGVITDIQVINSGRGYLAPPKIDIIGAGAGATAEATIDDQGGVSSITVTNGGSGYWPLPTTPNPGASSSPIPAANQGAIVVVSTGYVVNLSYR
jgi:hypothetical protein